MTPTSVQMQAIESDATEIVVVAGPGSGKTATTVQRINRLVEVGYDSKRMVALTFTNAAANELVDRLAKLKPCDPIGPIDGIKLGYCGTLHGFALRCLKQYGQSIGYGERLALIGEEAIADLIESKAKSLGCKTPLKKLLAMKAAGPDTRKITKTRWSLEETVIRSYYAELRESGLVDFDTILSEFLVMVQRPGFDLPFTHLFVDEVQDSAVVDWEIYRALPMANKFFVGDPDQSIYAFRGGRPDLMVEAVRRASGIALEANFRSHSEICDAANALIERNVERIHKSTISAKGPGGRVVVFRPALNEGDEIAGVVEAIKTDVACQFVEMKEIAILARNNNLCAAYRDQLRAVGIPVAEEAKPDLPLDWARAKSLVELLVNPENDTLAMFYLIAKHMADGVTPEVARKAAHSTLLGARCAGVSMNRYEPDDLGFGRATLSTVSASFGIEDITAESRMRVASIIRRLPADADLLQLALAMAQDQGEKAAAVDGVTVTTLHGAKGREWDTVFLVGFEDELLPGNRKSDGPAQVEEARRLAYVGVTRARKNLFIAHSLSRKTSWGAVEAHKISRFVKEMGL